MQTARRGALLIADITGYSAYLNESELAHAEQTLSALLELLVDQTRPPMVVSKLEGDAVFSYGFEEAALRGQAFVESLEGCYVEFRRALDLMVLNTTCSCNACANISTLDLKFFVHHGEFVVGEAAGRSELHGPDVNLLHRMLKNTVSEETGIRAYVLYTQQAVDALDLGQLTGNWVTHVETFADVGEVTAWIEDLASVWERAKAGPAVVFPPEDISIEVSTDIGLPAEVVWSYVTDTTYRRFLMGSDRIELEAGTKRDRIGEGTAYVCYHGDRQMSQLILEWEPLRRIVTRDTGKIMGATLTFPVEYELEPVDGGTRLTLRGMKPEGSWGVRHVAGMADRRMTKKFQDQMESFRDVIEADAADRLVSAEP